MLLAFSALLLFAFSTPRQTASHVRHAATSSVPEVASSTRPAATSTTATTFSAPSATTSVRVPILVYHGVRDTAATDSADVRLYNVAPSVLEEELTHLDEQGYTTITFKDLARYFDTGSPLPPKPIIISFDDGWRTQYENALPILQEHHMHATFFIFTNGIDVDTFMTLDDLKTLVADGMEIGSHSRSHLYMTKQDEGDLPREVAGSKKVLEDELGITVTSFAYPFGLYNDRIKSLLANAGYTMARTLNKSVMQHKDRRLELNSYLVSNNIADFKYIVDVLGR